MSEAYDWTHGVYMAATMASETTAAIVGKVGVVRRDPFAMLPFCGYHFGDYFKHWLKVGRTLAQPPKIFSVNWFRKRRERQVHLAGFWREHARAEMDRRALRRDGESEGHADRPHAALRRSRLDRTHVTRETYDKLTNVDPQAWREEVKDHARLFEQLKSRLPGELAEKRKELEKAIS